MLGELRERLFIAGDSEPMRIPRVMRWPSSWSMNSTALASSWHRVASLGNTGCELARRESSNLALYGGVWLATVWKGNGARHGAARKQPELGSDRTAYVDSGEVVGMKGQGLASWDSLSNNGNAQTPFLRVRHVVTTCRAWLASRI